MSINALIQTSRPTANELIERFRTRTYFVDNSFQRRLVWTEKQKVRLIETVLTNFPMPELYLWQQPADPDSGVQRHSVVDGQQRITTLVQFVSNEWPLRVEYLDESNRSAFFAGKLWMELQPDEKRVLWDYVLNIRTIPNSITELVVRNVFKRLNETDRSLNPQELRNAEFNGQFITAAERIADNRHWREWAVFKDGQIRRMADIQLASSLLIFLRNGVVGDTAETINAIYDLYNDTYETREQDIAEVEGFLERADNSYFTDNDTKAFFTKPLHIYTLFCLDRIAADRGWSANSIREGLNSFTRAYAAGEDDAHLNSYRVGSSSRTASKASRDRRVNGLFSWMMDHQSFV